MGLIKWTVYTVEATLLEPLLGTIAKNPKVWEDYQASLAMKRNAASPVVPADVDTGLPIDEGPAELAEGEEPTRGWTTFHTDVTGEAAVNGEGYPVLMDYQIKGALKEAGNTLKDKGANVKNLRSHIDNQLFVRPRRIQIGEVKIADLDYLERPLRAMTQQGPRVTLVRSDMIPEGLTFQWIMKVLPKSVVTEEVLEFCLEYLSYKGLGQWRNGSYGQIEAKIVDKTEE